MVASVAARENGIAVGAALGWLDIGDLANDAGAGFVPGAPVPVEVGAITMGAILLESAFRHWPGGLPVTPRDDQARGYARLCVRRDGASRGTLRPNLDAGQAGAGRNTP